MHLASLSDDVLFYLMKFVDPIDRFNLVLSGIFKGFENVSRVIKVHHRYLHLNLLLFKLKLIYSI